MVLSQFDPAAELNTPKGQISGALFRVVEQLACKPLAATVRVDSQTSEI